MNLLFMEEAVRLSMLHIETGAGGPFGCVIVRGAEVIGSGWNSVLQSRDPTAHAEMNAIRDACRHLQHHQLSGCDIYTTCEPCPMCMGAIYWARPRRVYFANTRADAAAIGFDDVFIYEELKLEGNARKIPFIRLAHPPALEAFRLWRSRGLQY